MAVPNPDSSFGLDGSAKRTEGYAGSGGDLSLQDDARYAGSIGDEDPDKLIHERGSPLGTTLLRLAKLAYEQGTTFHQSAVRPAWVKSYRAFANRHFDGSKYGSPEYRGRSKLFRPKTRSAVNKRQAQAAQALFSTGDIVSVSAQNEADPFQVASASVKQELMNYRLSRQTQRSGIRWFLICMGAIQDSSITGLCVSKQTWKFKEAQDHRDSPSHEASEGGVIEAVEQVSRIVEDRPDIHLFAPENVIFDPNADWSNPAQTAQYIDLRYPMSADDAATFIKQNKANKRVPFFDISKAELASYVDSSGPADTLGTRAARQQGKDPIMLSSGEFGALWLHEWFIRYEGDDWCFWTINNNVLLSEPVLVSEAYPEQGGDRPIVIGYGALEAHRAYPMSPVEALQQMQYEINDQVNLRLDHMKQVVTPQMQVRRGQKVDTQQLQRRGPGGVVMVNNIGDIEPIQMPDVPQSAFVENNYLNQDFDDLAGSFNPTGTQQSNAGASETFGGLSLLANGASATSDFALTVFVETWVAPVLSQILKLEEMYESDATVLEIAGERAKLFEKFGLDIITDQMLMAETTVTIKAGVGASAHPMEKLSKFQMAMGALTQFFTPFVQSGVMQMPIPRAKEIMDFAFGAVGIPEGAERFFSNMDTIDQPKPPAPPQPDPKVMAMMQANQLKAQQIQVTAQKSQIDGQTKIAALQQRAQETKDKGQIAAADRTAEMIKTHMKALAEIERAKIDNLRTHDLTTRQHGHDRGMAAMGTFHDLLKAGAQSAARMAEQAAQPKPQQATGTPQ